VWTASARAYPETPSEPKLAQACFTTIILWCIDRDIASHRIASHHIASHRIASHRITSHRITSHHIASHHIASHRITSHRIVYGRLWTRSEIVLRLTLLPYNLCSTMTQLILLGHDRTCYVIHNVTHDGVLLLCHLCSLLK
jgi:hypothetical protein